MSGDEPPDVPSPIDLRDPVVASAWAEAADVKGPWRPELRAAIAAVLQELPPPLRVLELGPGPGLLAEVILATCTVERYTLYDFSPPFLEMCRARVGSHPAVSLVLGDFLRPDWHAELAAPFDAVVSMQAVHELRHKRRAPTLYRGVREVLRPGGLLVVCDHVPKEGDARTMALNSTEAEQHAALAAAGFDQIVTRVLRSTQYVCSGRRPP